MHDAMDDAKRACGYEVQYFEVILERSDSNCCRHKGSHSSFDAGACRGITSGSTSARTKLVAMPWQSTSKDPAMLLQPMNVT
jgi:hypothetical protein